MDDINTRFQVSNTKYQTIFNLHALQLLNIARRELGVSSLCDARVLGRHRVLTTEGELDEDSDAGDSPGSSRWQTT